MKYQFSDIVDIKKLENLLQGFYSVTGLMATITDTEGNFLISVGWQDICTKFHRANPITTSLCTKSNTRICKYIHSKKSYITYKCINGINSSAAPIIIDGLHLASIFHGQFFFEKPDMEYFRQQAKKYGFNEADYLEAVKQVPFFSQKEIDSIMNCYIQLANIIAQMGLANLKLLKSKENVVRENKERLKIIVNNTPNVSVRSYDKDRKVIFWNNAAEKIIGLKSSETIGKNLKQLGFHLKNSNEFSKLIDSAEKFDKTIGPIERTFINKNGETKTVYSTVFPICLSEEKKEFICIDIDLTEKKQFEKHMARLDQLNLVGEMAASIGHEIRNPLTTVRGFLQILGEKDSYNKDKEYFNLMIEELDRANSIITEFLSLAKNKTIKLEKANLNTIIIALEPLIRANLIVHNQLLNLELKVIPDLLLDEKEIRQLILNLTRNAMEAMPSGGDLTIKTFVDNNEVVLLVQDQGHGIAPELIDKLGTPFFSTKDNGTGLGLAVCYSIATRHNTTISVDSNQEGTTFFIRFKHEFPFKC